MRYLNAVDKLDTHSNIFSVYTQNSFLVIPVLVQGNVRGAHE
jgi:hypothetical protein